MEPLVVIERLGRGGEVVERLRATLQDGRVLRIGRGYDCELMLDDPCVAVEHMRIGLDADGKLQVEDAGSRNGLRLLGRGPRLQRTRVEGRCEVEIGHTRLRILDGREPLAPERLLPAAQASGWTALAWLLLALGLSLFGEWLGQTEQIEINPLVVGLSMIASLCLVWSLGWSLATRLFTHELRFVAHLRRAAQFVVAASLAALLLPTLAFAFGSAGLSRYSHVLDWMLFGTLCWAHLRIVGAGHPRLKAGLVASLTVLAIAVSSLDELNPQRDGDSDPDFLGELQPAFLRLRAQQTPEQFFAAAGAIEKRLQQARAAAQQEESDAPAAD